MKHFIYLLLFLLLPLSAGAQGGSHTTILETLDSLKKGDNTFTAKCNAEGLDPTKIKGELITASEEQLLPFAQGCSQIRKYDDLGCDSFLALYKRYIVDWKSPSPSTGEETEKWGTNWQKNNPGFDTIRISKDYSCIRTKGMDGKVITYDFSELIDKGEKEEGEGSILSFVCLGWLVLLTVAITALSVIFTHRTQGKKEKAPTRTAPLTKATETQESKVLANRINELQEKIKLLERTIQENSRSIGLNAEDIRGINARIEHAASASNYSQLTDPPKASENKQKGGKTQAASGEFHLYAKASGENDELLTDVDTDSDNKPYVIRLRTAGDTQGTLSINPDISQEFREKYINDKNIFLKLCDIRQEEPNATRIEPIAGQEGLVQKSGDTWRMTKKIEVRLMR